MADFYVITSKKLERHLTLRDAEDERGRLSVKHPEKKFRILRCADGLHKQVDREPHKMEGEP